MGRDLAGLAALAKTARRRHRRAQPPGQPRLGAVGHRPAHRRPRSRRRSATTSIRGTRSSKAAAWAGRRRRCSRLPRMKMIAVKDAFWEKGPKGWASQNCPMGEGMVDWALVRDGDRAVVVRRTDLRAPRIQDSRRDAGGAAPQHHGGGQARSGVHEAPVRRGRARGRARSDDEPARLPRTHGAPRRWRAALARRSARRRPSGASPPARRPTSGSTRSRSRYEEHRYRAPLKFGGTLTDRVTILNVQCVVSAKNGKSARGFGSMPMGNVWSWPSRTLSYDQTLEAMKALAGRVRDITAAHRPYGHPIDLMWTLEAQYLDAAREIATRARAGRADPQAVHADRGQPVRRRAARRLRQAARPQLLPDLRPRVHDATTSRTTSAPSSRASGSRSTSSRGRSRACRSITWSAPSIRSRTRTSRSRLNDGLPETLPEWIRANGLTHLKIKLNGDDLAWDVDRVVRVDRVATAAQAARGATDVGLLARLQRALPERRLPARLPRADQAADAGGLRPHPVHRAADGARPEGEPRAT